MSGKSEPEAKGRRERRGGWAAARGFELTDRDVAILYAIGRSKVLRTRDVLALFFGGRATANDRLRKLFVAGLVVSHVRQLAGDNLYTLTERGRAAVCDRLDVDRDELAVPRTLPARLDHLIGINHLRVLFTVATRAPSAGMKLRSFRPEWELAAERHASLIGVLPDALVELEDAAGKVHDVALEVDLGTEAPTVVAKKLERYAQYAQARTPLYGVDVGTVLITAPGARRLRSIARAAPTSPALTVRLGDLGSLRAESLFGQFSRPASLLVPGEPSRSHGGSP